MKTRICVLIAVLAICFSTSMVWGQSFPSINPSIPQPIMIQMPTFQMPGANLLNGNFPMPQFSFPNITMPHNGPNGRFNMPSIPFPSITMPNTQGVFSLNSGSSSFGPSAQNAFERNKFPINQVNPMMIDPFKQMSSPKILSNRVPSWNIPGAVAHDELSKQEMRRMGFSTIESNLEKVLLAGKGQNNNVSLLESGNIQH